MFLVLSFKVRSLILTEEESMSVEFIGKIIEAFKTLANQIEEKGGEFDFRHSFANLVLQEALDWRREKGKGHYRIERDRKDVICFDDLNFPVLLIETKAPSERNLSKYIPKLKDYLRELGAVKEAMLTNGHELILFRYNSEKGLTRDESISIDKISDRNLVSLSKREKDKILKLRRLTRERFVVEDPEYFERFYREIPVNRVEAKV